MPHNTSPSTIRPSGHVYSGVRSIGIDLACPTDGTARLAIPRPKTSRNCARACAVRSVLNATVLVTFCAGNSYYQYFSSIAAKPAVRTPSPCFLVALPFCRPFATLLAWISVHTWSSRVPLLTRHRVAFLNPFPARVSHVSHLFYGSTDRIHPPNPTFFCSFDTHVAAGHTPHPVLQQPNGTAVFFEGSTNASTTSSSNATASAALFSKKDSREEEGRNDDAGGQQRLPPPPRTRTDAASRKWRRRLRRMPESRPEVGGYTTTLYVVSPFYLEPYVTLLCVHYPAKTMFLSGVKTVRVALLLVVKIITALLLRATGPPRGAVIRSVMFFCGVELARGSGETVVQFWSNETQHRGQGAIC